MSGIIGGRESKVRSGLVGGSFVHMVDHWRTTTEVNRDDSVYGKTGESIMSRISNYARGDGTNAIVGGKIKMSLNTTYGVWSFPIRGIYKVTTHTRVFNSTTTAVPNAYVMSYIIENWNGSSGTENGASVSGAAAYHQYSPVKTVNDMVLRVENTPTSQSGSGTWTAVKFRHISTQAACYIEGNANGAYNHFIFERIGNL